MSNKVNGTWRASADVSLVTDDYGITGTILSMPVNLADGHSLAVDACDALFHDQADIADAASVEIDLLTELDPKGVALALATVHMIFIRNLTPVGATAASIIVGGAGANAWSACFGDPSDTIIIPPAMSLVLPIPCVAGLVVDGTHKKLKLLHNGVGTAVVTYEIIVIGKR